MVFHLQGVQNPSAVKGVIKLSPEIFTGHSTDCHSPQSRFYAKKKINKQRFPAQSFQKIPNVAHQLARTPNKALHLYDCLICFFLETGFLGMRVLVQQLNTLEI